ncbi:MAG: ComEC family competence protein [Bacteroidales bacterium]|jgi:competence protein ComEC|nr:ComEC family competence protein [Bacteroidales bacterium]
MSAAFFHQTPFFRFLLPFIAGIVTGFYISIISGIWIITCIFIFIILCFLQRIWKKLVHFRTEWIFGILVYIFLFLTGISIASTPSSVHSDQTEQGVYMVVIEEAPVERERSIRTTALIKSGMSDTLWENRNEKIMMYLRKDSLSKKIKQGDLLIIETTLTPISNAGNPHEFDYRSYLKRKQIGRSTFIENGKWKLLEQYAQGPLINFSNRIRYHLLGIYERADISGNELAVASALTLGYKAYLEDELRMAYSASGAMHVLAVSGLHVGIIYLILSLILDHIAVLQRNKWLWTIIMLSALWLYALITGLSPSVLRATTMFSIIVIGKSFQRRSYIYNSIAASAFLLLFINPYNLLDVGFQLSYVAVIAIVFLQPRFYHLLHFKNSLADKAWSLACVSIAAQIGTAPLSLYYFHQFPSYFLLTNFIVIPAASVVIYGALILFILSPFQIVLEWVGRLFDQFLYFLNSCIFFIEKLPGSILSNIRFQGWEILLVYSLIASISIWLFSSRKSYLFLTLFLCLFWIAGSNIRDYRDFSRKQMIVYHTQGNSLIKFINGRNDIMWYQSRNESFNPLRLSTNQRIAMQTRNILCESFDSIFSQTKNKSFPNLLVSGNFIQFGDKRMAFFNQKYHPDKSAVFATKIDIAILTRDVPVSIQKVVECYMPETIIMDASNSQKKVEQWEQECIRQGVKYHITGRNGAFIYKIK